MCGLPLNFRPGTVKSESSLNWDTTMGGFEIPASASKHRPKTILVMAMCAIESSIMVWNQARGFTPWT